MGEDPGVAIGSLAHLMAKGIAWAWRLQSDRRSIASMLGRYSAHLGLLVLVVLLFLVGQATLTPVSVANVASPSALQVVAEPVATPTAVGFSGATVRHVTSQSQGAISRRAVPYTTVPERVRLEVITYTVGAGDTVYGIAEKFELSPYSIVWSNMETLQGAPWDLQPGLILSIPPIDGAYHTVARGETLEEIALAYEVEVSSLYNVWNAIDPESRLREGLLLVIPNGIGPDFDWEPPPPPPNVMVAQSTSYYGSVDVSMTGASGWFVLPTGSYAVSGWYFHDPRNPGHIGLDYRCSLGDAIYAADSGIVIFSGWSGGYGNLVRVDHGNGFTTRYAHFDSIYVTAGQYVTQGQVLGACGTTGWSTGPHLHYEIRFNGVAQDPLLYEP
ncbi:MAG: peptidoglycan DD-metalloendopeptidase family protein [Anaerolineae bacterium]|nr:peptidoglycan DD-metalloendopeptidase family protein [Anaerolineae bacterium]